MSSSILLGCHVLLGCHEVLVSPVDYNCGWGLHSKDEVRLLLPHSLHQSLSCCWVSDMSPQRLTSPAVNPPLYVSPLSSPYSLAPIRPLMNHSMGSAAVDRTHSLSSSIGSFLRIFPSILSSVIFHRPLSCSNQ